MAKPPVQDFPKRLRANFSAFISRRQERPAALSEVVRVVRQRGLTVFAFGGIPRGVLNSGRRYQPRDLDLVFEDQHFEFFESAFESFVQRRNSYGGLRLKIENMSVDAWPLSATWAFRTGAFSGPSFEKLPHTTFLNVDGIIVELSPKKGRARRIYEAGFFSAWNDRILDINLRENPYPAICVARALCISRRFGFRLSHDLATYLWDVLSSEPVEELLNAQIKHYGQIEFSKENLHSLRRGLEKHFSTSSPSPFALFQMEMPLFRESTPEWLRNCTSALGMSAWSKRSCSHPLAETI